MMKKLKPFLSRHAWAPHLLLIGLLMLEVIWFGNYIAILTQQPDKPVFYNSYDSAHYDFNMMIRTAFVYIMVMLPAVAVWQLICMVLDYAERWLYDRGQEQGRRKEGSEQALAR